MTRSSATRSHSMPMDLPSLDLGCEPTAPSEKSVASKPKFVDSRRLVFEEHLHTTSGELTITFDCLARDYVEIMLIRSGTSESSTRIGRWRDRHELMPVLREMGAVPAGWERVYGSGPDHTVPS